MRSAWGVFRAIKMTGLDDRGGFYQFWYATVDLVPGERLVAAWKAIRTPASWMGAAFGNLLISDRRLIFEPYSSKRAAYAPHGMKIAINSFAKLAEQKAPPIARAIAFPELAAIRRTSTRGMSTLTVVDSRGEVSEFLLSATRPPIGTGHQQRRDEAALRISRAAMLDVQ